MDSLYPSLNREKCVRVIVGKLDRSELRFENLKWKEIALYLRYNMKVEDIAGSQFEQFLPTRRFNRRAPLFTRSGSRNEERIRYSPWRFPNIKPDERMTRTMFFFSIILEFE